MFFGLDKCLQLTFSLAILIGFGNAPIPFSALTTIGVLLPEVC